MYPSNVCSIDFFSVHKELWDIHVLVLHNWETLKFWERSQHLRYFHISARLSQNSTEKMIVCLSEKGCVIFTQVRASSGNSV